MDIDFDWNLMRSFLAVMEHGSLGRAARALASTQPTLGRHVRQLEEQLGQPLFDRRGQSADPTPLAQRLADAGQAMLNGAIGLQKVLQEHAAGTSGAVRITSSRSACCHLLPPILARMQEDPGSPVIELVSVDEISNLVQREADIAVRFVRPDQPSIVARRIGTVHFGLFASIGYLKRRGVPQTTAELAGHALVGFDADQQMMRNAQRMGLRINRSALSFRSDDRIVHWAAVRGGSGIGVLPYYAAKGDSQLRRVLPDVEVTPAPVWLAMHRDSGRRPHVKWAYGFLRDALIEVLQSEDFSPS